MGADCRSLGASRWMPARLLGWARPETSLRVGGKLGRAGGRECLECHEGLIEQAGRPVVHEPFENQEGCEICHRRHGVVGTLALQESEPGLCLRCHEEQRSDMAGPHVHAPLSTGPCSVCHEPHASVERALLISPPREGCISCHGSVIDGEIHAPAAEDCMVCHEAHSSGEPGLLSSPAAELCVDCHALLEMEPLHDGYLGSSPQCQDCHNPHSSSKPGLLRPAVHAPLADCAVCHETAGEVSQSGEALCAQCHSVVTVGDGVHEPVESGSCDVCHEPHASQLDGLLVAGETVLCLACHDEVARKLATAAPHPPAVDGDCSGCHLPHGGDRKGALRAGIVELCSSCHEDVASPADHHLVGPGDCSECQRSPWLERARSRRAPRCGALREMSRRRGR